MWLDNFEYNNEKRIEFGETYKEEIQNLSYELLNLWDSGHYSPHFENFLKISSGSLSYTIGLDSSITIIDEGQSGSTTFNHTKSMTSTSTPKDIQTNTGLQLKQKSTIKPDKPLTSKLFRFQNNANYDGAYFSDAEDKELHFDKWLPPSVNQRVRKKDPEQLPNYQNSKYKSNNTLTNNQEQRNINFEQKA